MDESQSQSARTSACWSIDWGAMDALSALLDVRMVFSRATTLARVGAAFNHRIEAVANV